MTAAAPRYTLISSPGIREDVEDMDSITALQDNRETGQMEVAERAIIGSMLIDARAIPEVLAATTPDDFLDEGYRRLYVAARDLYNEGGAVDVVTILDRAGSDLQSLAVVCMDNTPTAASAVSYCEVLHRQRDLLQLQRAGLAVASAETLDAALAALDDARGAIDAAKGRGKGRSTFSAYNLGEYLAAGSFEKDIAYFKAYQHRKTGFPNIDRYLTLYPGLAALGGSASLGKTTFAVNLADNLTAAGETVLYFAMEQEPVELITKSLARRLYLRDPFSKITNTDIKNGASSPELEAVKRDYAASAARFVIVRCSFTTTAEEIREYVEGYISQHGCRPVVFIDYLQLVSPPAGFRGDARLATDHVIKTFKAMQINNELLVILISNFNRASYATPASYEAFKETGMIEFTCDYVWGLQLAALEDDDFYTAGGRPAGKETTVKAKKDALFEATRKDPKEVEFVSLKSRNGKQAYKCFFKYHMAFDYFEPDAASKYDARPAGPFYDLDDAGENTPPFDETPLF